MSDLTDDELHKLQTSQIAGHHVDALCEAGDDFKEAFDSFMTWLATVKSKARQEVADLVRSKITRSNTDYSEGYQAALRFIVIAIERLDHA